MRDVGKNCEQRNLVRSLDAKSKTVAEVSGRCHSTCQITAARRSGPLDRLVRLLRVWRAVAATTQAPRRAITVV